MSTLQRLIKYCAMAFAIFLIVSIIGGIVGGLGAVFRLFDRGSGSVAGGEMRTIAISGPVENLDLEISAAALKIVKGEDFSLQTNHKYLTVKEIRGTLEISEEKLPLGSSFEGVTVILTVPEGFVFQDASLETGAGKVDIETLSAGTLELDLGAGATEIGSLRAATRAKVETGAGKLTIRDAALNDLDMDVGVGKLEFTGRLTGSCDVDFGIGDAVMTLLGTREDYCIRMDKGIGQATLDGEAMGDGSTYGGGRNRLNISGGIGSIRIRFQADRT